MLLELGVACGWEPAGTVPLEPEAYIEMGCAPPRDYDPARRFGYDTNDGQRVTDEDAKAWATALYRALPLLDGKWAFVPAAYARKMKKALAGLTAEHAGIVREFADAASKGGFQIG
jgi:hypothetical protein